MTEALDLGKLLPCPFCGNPGQLERGTPHNPTEWACGCEVCDIYRDFCKTSEEAIAGWNTRAPDDRLLSRLRDVEDWQPIETAPRDGTLVDIWSGGRYADMFWCAAHGAWGRKEVRSRHLITSVKVGLEPTHWMPLPEPPARAALSNSPLGEGLGSSRALLRGDQASPTTAPETTGKDA